MRRCRLRGPTECGWNLRRRRERLLNFLIEKAVAAYILLEACARPYTICRNVMKIGDENRSWLSLQNRNELAASLGGRSL